MSLQMPRLAGSGRPHRRQYALLALASVVLAIGMVACSRPGDEQQLRAAMASMQVAMEEGKPADFMHHVADDFTGAQGGLDRPGLHNLLRGQVLSNARIGVSLGPVDVELHGDRATVQLTATFTGGNARWLPERGAVYRIVSGWRKQSGRWLCVNARWEQVL